MPRVRKAAHAGSWYSDDPARLAAQIDACLDAGATTRPSEGVGPVRAIIGPHAGYSYCGEVLGSAYCHLPAGCRTVIIAGPSHHVYYRSGALSRAEELETPLGTLRVDTDAVGRLHASGLFDWMDAGDDEAEHCVEMHLPFLLRAAERAGADASALRVVPVVLGDLDDRGHARVAAALAPLLADETTVMAVSTDFCHWGRRFRYTRRAEAAGRAIADGIEAMDREGMEAASTLRPAPLAEYLRRTENTICGRHALAVLLHAVEAGSLPGKALRWMSYAQSGRVESPDQSSVSYAAGVLSS